MGLIMPSTVITRLGSAVLEYSPMVREVLGSIPGVLIQNNLKMVVMASLLGAQDLRVSIMTTASNNFI